MNSALSEPIRGRAEYASGLRSQLWVVLEVWKRLFLVIRETSPVVTSAYLLYIVFSLLCRISFIFHLLSKFSFYFFSLFFYYLNDLD
jgi:hypothetical protein